MKNKLVKGLMALLLVGNIALVNPATTYAWQWTDSISDAYTKLENVDDTYKDGLYELAFFDGIDQAHDWKTIYAIKNGKKNYLESMLTNSGFKNITVAVGKDKFSGLDVFNFNCLDENNNKIKFEIREDVGDTVDTEGQTYYYNNLQLAKFYINGKIPTVEYMKTIEDKPNGLALAHGIKKIFRIQYGLEKKPQHVDYNKEKLKIRNISETIDDWTLKSSTRKAADDYSSGIEHYIELYYENANKNKIRYDENLELYKQKTPFTENDVLAYFDYKVDDKFDFWTSIIREGFYAVSLTDMMQDLDYRLDENKCTMKEKEADQIAGVQANALVAQPKEKEYHLFFYNSKHEIELTIIEKQSTAIDNKNNSISTTEYAMLTPKKDGELITRNEWQDMLNESFYKTHATANIDRELIEANIRNTYGFGEAKNYSL